MSNWTDEKHEAARALADYYDHPREISFTAGDIPTWEHLAITLGSALDEIERLRAVLDEMERMRSTLNLVINTEAGA